MSGILAGEEPSSEQSDFLDVLDEAWDQRLEEMKRYKVEVFDLDDANTDKPFFIPGSEGEYLSFHNWLIQQVKLYENEDWRNNDKLILDTVCGPTQKNVSELRKIVLARRKEKLSAEGVKFDVSAMEKAARVKPARAKNLLAKRRAAIS